LWSACQIAASATTLFPAPVGATTISDASESESTVNARRWYAVGVNGSAATNASMI
jgi:hypothetical protein